jgi:hypothetical protein
MRRAYHEIQPLSIEQAQQLLVASKRRQEAMSYQVSMNVIVDTILALLSKLLSTPYHPQK